MIKFKVNNDLKSEPVILGLRVSNIINLAMIAVVGIVCFGISGHLGISKSTVGIGFILVFTFAYFYLKNMEQKADYGYMDKFLARIFQPKKVLPSDMKSVLLNRKKNEIRGN